MCHACIWLWCVCVCMCVCEWYTRACIRHEHAQERERERERERECVCVCYVSRMYVYMICEMRRSAGLRCRRCSWYGHSATQCTGAQSLTITTRESGPRSLVTKIRFAKITEGPRLLVRLISLYRPGPPESHHRTRDADEPQPYHWTRTRFTTARYGERAVVVQRRHPLVGIIRRPLQVRTNGLISECDADR